MKNFSLEKIIELYAKKKLSIFENFGNFYRFCSQIFTSSKPLNVQKDKFCVCWRFEQNPHLNFFLVHGVSNSISWKKKISGENIFIKVWVFKIIPFQMV